MGQVMRSLLMICCLSLCSIFTSAKAAGDTRVHSDTSGHSDVGVLIRQKVVPNSDKVLLLFRRELSPEEKATLDAKAQQSDPASHPVVPDKQLQYIFILQSIDGKERWPLWSVNDAFYAKDPISIQFQIVNFVLDMESKTLVVVSTESGAVTGEVIPLPSTRRTVPPSIAYKSEVGDIDTALIHGSVGHKNLAVTLINVQGKAYRYKWTTEKWIKDDREATAQREKGSGSRVAQNSPKSLSEASDKGELVPGTKEFIFFRPSPDDKPDKAGLRSGFGLSVFRTVLPASNESPAREPTGRPKESGITPHRSVLYEAIDLVPDAQQTWRNVHLWSLRVDEIDRGQGGSKTASANVSVPPLVYQSEH